MRTLQFLSYYILTCPLAPWALLRVSLHEVGISVLILWMTSLRYGPVSLAQ